MKIIFKDKIIGSTVLSLLALFAVLFGGYLIYEKVYLSLLTGHTHERAGIIFRVDDPGFFWLWVLTYALAGGLIAIGGLWLAWRVLKSMCLAFSKNRKDNII